MRARVHAAACATLLLAALGLALLPTGPEAADAPQETATPRVRLIFEPWTMPAAADEPRQADTEGAPGAAGKGGDACSGGTTVAVGSGNCRGG